MNLPKTGSILRKLLIIIPVVVGLTLVSLFMPAQRLSIEGIGTLSFETTVTLSVGSEVAYAAPDLLQLIPDGAGDYTNIASVTGAATHWEAVDDPVLSPDDATTYVYTTSTIQQKDAYTLADTSQAGTITSVKVYFRVASSAANKIHFMQPFLRLGENETTGTEISHSVKTWTTYSEILARPGGGSWTWADINNLQVAVGLKDADTGNPQLTQVYVEVDYIPAAVPDISNLPIEKVFGLVNTSTDYWSNDSAPTWPLDDTECFFTVTNNSSQAVNIAIRATDFSGGTPGWTLGATPGADTVVLKVGKSGDSLETNMVTLTTSDQAFITALGASTPIKWELKMETPTSFSNGDPKSSTITLTATFV